MDAMEPMLLQSYGGGIPTILLSHLLGCVSVFNVRYPRSDLTTAKFIALWQTDVTQAHITDQSLEWFNPLDKTQQICITSKFYT